MKPVKTPVVLQMEASECGAASLCMILAFYNCWVPLEKMRIDCGVSRDGSTALNIVKAARNYGLNVSAKRYTPEKISQLNNFPCIIWWEYSHFVVVNGFRNGKFFLNDPAFGRISVTFEEFSQSYSGLCLLFEPNENFKTIGNPPSIINFLFQQLHNHKLPLIFILITSTLSMLIALLLPVFNDIFSETVLELMNKNFFKLFLLAYIFLVMFYAVSRLFNRYLIRRTTGQIAAESNLKFLQHMLKLPIEFFMQRMSGDLASRQTENDNVSEILIGNVLPTFTQLLLLVIYAIVLFNYDSVLCVICVAASLINLAISIKTDNLRAELLHSQQRDLAKLEGITASGLDMIEAIKSSGAEYGFFERWAGFYAAANTRKYSFSQINRILAPLPNLIEDISRVLLLTAGAWLILENEISEGIFLAFLSFAFAFMRPVRHLIIAGQDIHNMRFSMERVSDIFKYPDSVNNSVSSVESLLEAQKLSGNILVNNITFGYSRLSEPFIKNFSLEIKHGQHVALVGSSGSGKSTIAKLIAGLYQPSEGNILFDGVNRNDIPKEIIEGSLAVVDQDIILFKDSIANNISMWDDSIQDFDMILAARDARIHDEIIRRKGGYHSIVSERGRNFSGGQRQRIEIARALSVDPSILILDEATNALDAKTEADVVKSIRNRGITCLIVAHRLSTIRDCDLIIVMQNGKIIESGTHDELMKTGKLYSKLVTTE